MSPRRAVYFSAFLLVPALSAVTPLIAVPAITSTAGAQGWEAYALGLSIGQAAGVIVELGWPLTGPQRVAAEPAGQRWATLVSSLRTRTLALILLGPLAALAAFGLTVATGSEHGATATLMAVATATAGLSCNWYFTGVGRPFAILAADAIPRAALIAAAAVAVAYGAPLPIIPGAFLLAVLIGPIAGLLLARHERREPARMRLPDDLRVIRSQLTAMGGRSVAALYIALPVTIVGLVAPASLAAFAAAERLMRMSLTMLQAVPNALQNWLGAAGTSEEKRSRVLTVIRLNGTIGLVGWVVFALLAPWVTSILFTGTVDVDLPLAAAAGAVLALVCLSRATGPLGLVRYGRIGTVMTSAIAAAAVGLPAISVFAVLWGAVGATLGEVLAEITAVTIQIIVLRRAMRE